MFPCRSFSLKDLRTLRNTMVELVCTRTIEYSRAAFVLFWFSFRCRRCCPTKSYLWFIRLHSLFCLRCAFRFICICLFGCFCRGDGGPFKVKVLHDELALYFFGQCNSVLWCYSFTRFWLLLLMTAFGIYGCFP